VIDFCWVIFSNTQTSVVLNVNQILLVFFHLVVQVSVKERGIVSARRIGSSSNTSPCLIRHEPSRAVNTFIIEIFVVLEGLAVAVVKNASIKAEPYQVLSAGALQSRLVVDGHFA
jgi:hypothetical protein